VVHHPGEAVDLVLVERQRLPNLARRAAAAISDDVGGHRRAQTAVLLVNVLDHPLAAVAARQIEIDVGPLAALFRQEAFKQQVHRNRIDRRDPEAVADGTVGRRATALHEDVLLPAVADDVPDDQEIAGQIELVDQRQLALDLAARLVAVRPVALAGPLIGNLTEKRHHRLAVADRVDGKAIAEVVHRVLEPLAERPRAGQRVGAIGEQLRHRLGRLEVSLGVARQQPSAGVERGLVTDAGEDVEQPAVGRLGEADAVGGDDRHAERRRQLGQQGVPRFLIAQQVPLQLGVDICPAEDPDDAINTGGEEAGRRGDKPITTYEGNEAKRVAIELVEQQRPLPFRGTQLHPCHQPAQISIAFRGLHEDGKTTARPGIRDP
jgi:hypothetical protein